VNISGLPGADFATGFLVKGAECYVVNGKVIALPGARDFTWNYVVCF